MTDNVGSGGSGLLPVGADLHGRYRIVKVIGRGGMSAVYEAEHLGLGKKVAIKEMLLPVREGPEAEESILRFQNEARTLARLEHRYLPDVTDFFSQDDRYYLVMAYVTGETLDDLVRRTPGFLAEDLVLRWASQLCDVLSYLHSQTPPVVFRDLKPSNIMLDEGGQVKLIDFGIARIFKPGKQSDTQSMGTAGYSAPEQYGTGQTDARSDIYSLGACLHFLLTRRDPTSAPFNFPPIRELNPRVSANTERVVAKCLSMKPEERYVSAAEVKAALSPRVPEPDTTFLARPPALPRATAPPPPISLPPAPDRQGGWLVSLVVLVIVAAIGALIYLVKTGQTGEGSTPAPPVVTAPTTATVPDLTGKTESQARDALALAQLTMERHSEPSDLPPGHADRQDPAAGAGVPTGSVVKVYFSAGPTTVQVPDVGHMSVDQAKKMLGLKGLKLGQTTAQASDTIPEGYVIGSEPRAGLSIAPGQPVDLVLSNGPPPAPAPPPQAPAPAEPQFKVTVPVPPDGKPHDVKVIVRQTDGTLTTAFDHPGLQQNDVESVEAPSADAISATIDGADVTPDVQPLATPDSGAAPATPASGDQSDSP